MLEMPISEDEYDSQTDYSQDYSNSNQNMSKAELRKTNKPIMEKKRRARINNCLNELKDLLLDAMKKDPARHSKLEKADILELTVKHLQSLQRQQLAAAVAADPAVLRRFRDGFGDCAREVRRYLSRHNPPRAPPGLPQRLDTYLDSCVNSLHVPSAPPAFASHASAFRFVGHHERPSPPSSPDSACDYWRNSRTPPKVPLPAKPVAYPTPPSTTDRLSEQDSSPETQKATVSSTTISPETKIQMQRDAESKAKTYAKIKADNEDGSRRAALRVPDCSFPNRPLEAALDFSTVSATKCQLPSNECSSSSSERIFLPLDIIANYSPISTARAIAIGESPVCSVRSLKRSHESSTEACSKWPRVVVASAAGSVVAHGRDVTLRAEADTSACPAPSHALTPSPVPAPAPAPAPAPSTDTMWRPW